METADETGLSGKTQGPTEGVLLLWHHRGLDLIRTDNMTWFCGFKAFFFLLNIELASHLSLSCIHPCMVN